jgi:predicted  nucleic acid-binding Zn-ribbon protein
MSYAPIYSKLRDLENRLEIIESVPKTADAGNTISSFGLTTDTADTAAGILDELNHLKTNFTNLLNECNPLSERVGKLSQDIAALATKDEVATLATKDELPDVSGFATKAELPDVSGFATKAELPVVSGFATKEEVTDLIIKFDNLINVVSQLNIKINEANEKISALEDS